MKVVSILLLFIANISSIKAQIKFDGVSQKCDEAVQNFNNSKAGKELEKCEYLSEVNDFKGFCSNAKCINFIVPNEIKSGCTDGPLDMILVGMMDQTMKGFNELVKSICNDDTPKTEAKPSISESKYEDKPVVQHETGTEATQVTNTENKVENTPEKYEKKPSSNSSTTTSKATITTTKTTETVNNSPTENNKSIVPTSNNTVTNNNDVNSVNTNSIVQGNSTVYDSSTSNNSNNISTSSGSKLSYSLVTIIILVTFNFVY